MPKAPESFKPPAGTRPPGPFNGFELRSQGRKGLLARGLCAAAMILGMGLAPSAKAFGANGESPSKDPWYIRAVMSPIQDGMFVHLPIIDTDPNRGITYGVMPIWVYKGADDRIRYIHAPSLTYNQYFRLTPTYRIFYYPTKDSSLHGEVSYSQVSDRNLMLEYEDYAFLGYSYLASFKVQYNADGSNRFFGVGPDTSSKAESNYKQRTAMYRATFGIPIFRSESWKWIFSHEMAGDSISDGPVGSLPGIEEKFPSFSPAHRHQHSYFQGGLNYDTRDSPVTASQGAYVSLFAQTSQKSLASEYDYQRYGTDFRYFYKWPSGSKMVTAGSLYFNQVVGSAPFWLMPQLGGKYVLRAYGTGRYIDNGLLVSNLEQRITVHEEHLAGVTTEFQVAPFVGLGVVFDTPQDMMRKYYRPVYGAAVRAVAKPQVVGSIDFGLGQAGLSAFMDVDYSF